MYILLIFKKVKRLAFVLIGYSTSWKFPWISSKFGRYLVIFNLTNSNP
jgi:hypothetical protein